MIRQYFVIISTAAALFLAPGCMISHDLFFYTKAKVVKEKDRLRIVDGYNLVLGSRLVDATYDPPVEKDFFLEFNSAYPPLNIGHEVGGSSLKVYLLIRQGDKAWYCDNVAGTVTIKRRTREQILAFIEVAAHVVFDPADKKGRREEFGPTYIYRRAIDDVRDEDIDDIEAFR